MPATTPAHWRPLLARGRWFSALTADQQDALLQSARLLRLPAGAVLFQRGDANAGLYAVLDGTVCVGPPDAPGWPGKDSREALLSLLSPPQWFGEIACIDGGPRTHDATATTAVQLLLVPQPALLALADADPLWWRLLGQLLAEKVRALFSGLDDLTQLDASTRIARRLLAMAQGHGMLAPGIAQRSVAVNQAQLGAMLSLTRQTVSEVLRDFEARGWVRRGYRNVELLDWAALADAGQQPAGQRPGQ
jgi:CRP-like cAMP-binding protein